VTLMVLLKARGTLCAATQGGSGLADCWNLESFLVRARKKERRPQRWLVATSQY
jgi:hypothetical protein